MAPRLAELRHGDTLRRAVDRWVCIAFFGMFLALSFSVYDGGSAPPTSGTPQKASGAAEAQ